MELSGEERLVNAFEWQNKCMREVAILKKFIVKYNCSTSQKQKCLNLIQKFEYLRCHFDLLMKRGSGLNTSERVKWVEL